MRSVLLLLTLVLMTSSVFAKVDFYEIHSQFQSPTDPSLTILKLASGETAFWNHEVVSHVTPSELRDHEGMVQLDLNGDQEVQAISLVEGFTALRRQATPSSNLVEDPYRPSILADYGTAQQVLNSFDRNTIEDAQCYDKAHRWVYEEYIGYATKLMKVFLFFSDDYIARYKFKWWFHTAPFAYLRMQNQTTERVLDPTFSQYPLKFKLWTDLFMKNKVECKTISNYSEYVNDLKTDCFIQRATMYFWQPKDLEAFEDTGFQKTNFVPWEIDWAYLHGFGIRRPQ